MTSYNRYEYLIESVSSLIETRFPEDTLLVINDDASCDRRVKELLKDLQRISIPNLSVLVRWRTENVGVTANATDGIKYCFDHTGDEFIVLTNSDAIYHPDWLLKLIEARDILTSKYKVGAITAFNMEYKDKDPYGHQVIETLSNGLRRKKSLGGLGVMISRKPFCLMKTYENGWDCRFVDTCHEYGFELFATDVSYVQHIGHEGLHSRSCGEIDSADDFVGI